MFAIGEEEKREWLTLLELWVSLSYELLKGRKCASSITVSPASPTKPGA